MAKYGTQIRFVYKQFPLTSMHEHALLYSQASEAAGLQGKFYEMIDKIFGTGVMKLPTQDDLYNFAKELGLDVERFKKDMNSPEVKKKIQDDLDLGERVGVKGTPTFMFNGYPLFKTAPHSPECFGEIIEKLLAQTGK